MEHWINIWFANHATGLCMVLTWVPPFNVQRPYMVRQTLKILRHLLQNLESMSDHALKG